MLSVYLYVVHVFNTAKMRCYVIALKMPYQQTVSTLCSCSKEAHFACMKLLTISPVTWGDRDVTLKKKNSIDYLTSTIPEQRLHQHLVFQKEH